MTLSCDIFLTIGSLLSFSPELQALLMNQLTVKVRVRGVKAPLALQTWLYMHVRYIFGKLQRIICCLLFSPQGLKKLGQSIESSYSSIQKLVISHLQRYFQLFTSPPRCCPLPEVSTLVLCLQRLWSSAVSPQRSERNVPVEAEVWAPRIGFSSYRRYHSPWVKKHNMFLPTPSCVLFF